MTIINNPGVARALTLASTLEWAVNTPYLLGVVVSYAGALQVCTTPHTSSSSFDNTKWARAIEGVSHRVPYSTNSPFNQQILGSSADVASSGAFDTSPPNTNGSRQAVTNGVGTLAAIRANQINSNGQTGVMNATDPTTQFAATLSDAGKATAKASTGETGQLPVYVFGALTQITQAGVPVTRTNSFGQEINVPGNWGDLVSDGTSDSNAEVVNWQTGEEWGMHQLGSSVAKLLTAQPTKNLIGSLTGNIVTTGTITVPAGGVPAGTLVTVMCATEQTVASDPFSVPTDTRGNVYTLAAGKYNTAGGYGLDMFTCFLTTALLAGDTITIHVSGTIAVCVEAWWWLNTNGGAIDAASVNDLGTASITTANPSDLVIAVTNEWSSFFTYAAPWVAMEQASESVHHSQLSAAYQLGVPSGTVETTPNAGRNVNNDWTAVGVLAVKLSTAAQGGNWPAGSSVIQTNSPVLPSTGDLLRIGTPGGSNWETVTVLSGTSVTNGTLTVTPFVNSHPVGDLVIDCWTTTSLAAPGVSVLNVPLAGTGGVGGNVGYLNNGPQHLILGLGESHQETVLVASLASPNATLSVSTTKAHPANCSVAAICASSTFYSGPSAGVNYNGVPGRTSTNNSQLANSGAAVPYLAGLITAFDISQGAINHVIGAALMDGAPNINSDGTFNSTGPSPNAYYKYPAQGSDQNAARSVSGASWTSGTIALTNLTTTSNSGNGTSPIAGQQVIVGYGTANAELLTIQAVDGGGAGHLSFTTALAKTHAAGEYVAPASTVPMGARFRLKQSFQAPSGKSSLFYMVVEALKRYGCYMRDGSGHSKLTFESQLTAQWGGTHPVFGAMPAIVPADLALIDWNQMELLALNA